MFGHERSDKVWFDALDFRAQCGSCGKPMVRDTIQREWRLFEPSDADPRRLSYEEARASGLD